MKKLSNLRGPKGKRRLQGGPYASKQQESTDAILNRLIFGDGVERRKKKNLKLKWLSDQMSICKGMNYCGSSWIM